MIHSTLSISVKQVKDLALIKESLSAAFLVDSFVTYEQFKVRWLHPGEPVNVFLAELCSLSVLLGRVSDYSSICVNMASFPENVKQLY